MKLIKVELQYEIQADGSSKTILTIDGQQESLSSSLGKGSREVSDFYSKFFPGTGNVFKCGSKYFTNYCFF